MKPQYLLLWAVLLIAFRGTAQNYNPASPLPLAPEIRVGVLPNGMHYYIQYNKTPEKRAELRLAVNAGSLLEEDNQLGLAHFCEHMAFNGTRHFKKNELVDYLESIGTKFGAHLNAFTSFDETVYMIQIPTDTPEIVEKGFLILEDWAHGLAFDSVEIDKERGVVIEEWRLGRGADERMREKYFPVLFKDSRYADRLPIGTKEVLESFSHETLRNFYRKWYRPDLMAIVAVGDFQDMNAIEAKIKLQFGSIPPASNPALRTRLGVPDQNDIRAAVARDKEAPYTTLMVLYNHDPKEILTQGDYREKMVMDLMSGMVNTRLNEYLQKSDPPFIYSGSFNGGFVREKDAYFNFAMVQPQNIQRALETLLIENQRAKKFGFLASELERAKANMLKEAEKALKGIDTRKSSDIAMSCAFHFLQKNPFPGEKWEYEMAKELLNGITLEEVNAMAKKRVRDNNIVGVLMAPEKEDIKVPSADDVQKIIANATQLPVEPYVDQVDNSPLVAKEPVAGKITSDKKISSIGVRDIKLSNGARVLLKKTDFAKGEIQMQALSPGGHSKASDGDFESAVHADQVFSESGVGKFNDAALQKKLAGKSASVSAWIDYLREGMNGECETSDFETLMQLTYLRFTAPRPDKEAFASFVNRQKGFLETMKNDPENAFRDTFYVTSRGNHPRFQPETAERLDKINLQRAFEFYLDRFSDPSDFTFVIVGDFDESKIIPLIEKYLGGIPTMGRVETWKDRGQRAPKGIINKTVYAGKEPKSLVNISIQGPFERTGENLLRLRATTDVLKITLREALREEAGGTYFVISNATTQKFPESTYSVTLGFGCAPERADSLTAILWQKVRELKQNGPGEKNLGKVKETIRRERETDMRENDFWMRTLTNSVWNQDELDGFLKMNSLLDKMTEKDVQEAAKRWLDENNYVRVVMKPNL